VERDTLRRVAFFRGGFTLHAAQTVAGATLPTLIRLIHKSLLQWEEHPAGGGRYAMHELLRQFALEQFDAAEGAVVEEGHAHYYLAFVAAWGLRLGRGEPKEASAAMQAELDNVRQGWQWAARSGDVAALDQAVYGWWQFCLFRGLEDELRATLAIAIEGLRQRLSTLSNDLAAHGQGERLLSKLLALYANSLFAQSQWQRMAALAQEAITLGQVSGGAEGEAFGYFVWGRALQELKPLSEAKAMYERAIATAQTHQPHAAHSELLLEVVWMGYSWLKGALQTLGDYGGGRACIVQALEICRTWGKVRAEMACLINLALDSFLRGDYATARQGYEEALPHFQALGAPILEGNVQREYGEILRLQGEYIEAQRTLERAVMILRASAAFYEAAWALAALVRVHGQLGDGEAANARRIQLHQLIQAHTLTQDCRVQALMAFATHTLLMGNRQQALAEAEEAWLLAQRYSIPSNRADAAVLLGHVRATLHEWEAAATAYQEAIRLYEQIGNRALVVEAQAGLAQIALEQGHHAEAYQLVEKILPLLNEQSASSCHTAFFVWLTAFRVLAANRVPHALTILQRGHDLLLRRANTIPNRELHRAFLAEVQAHRLLQQAYTEAWPT
jgi:tetratricopeptide (TPR) repeat protein